MTKSPDVAVIGLGVMGAALTHELARRGAHVVACDAAGPPHELGSSHGRTRIIREAYYEHPLYVPLVQRSLELWLELEELTGTVLYRQTGGLAVGRCDSELVRGALASARRHDIEHELLDADEMRRRFPALLPQADHAGVFEMRAGMLLSDACLRTLLALAQSHGATLLPHAQVTAWSRDADSIKIETTSEQIHAAHVVFAAGAWMNTLLTRGSGVGGSALSHDASPPVQLPLTVERQTPHWFQPRHGTTAFRAERCPVTLLQYDSGRMLYTLPDIGHGVKAGIHHEGAIVHADAVERTISLDEEQRVRTLLDGWMPGSAEHVLDASVCLYTNTPDFHFIVDRHPHVERVTLLSACSGHGFKFATALGEAVADWILEGASALDLAPFGLTRFTT